MSYGTQTGLHLTSDMSYGTQQKRMCSVTLTVVTPGRLSRAAPTDLTVFGREAGDDQRSDPHVQLLLGIGSKVPVSASRVMIIHPRQ